ncbi:hypothetical protein [uncultured Lactobacillus sp.]|uniref:hypothetical protein n=1 Tax=uncultured Lactobacillus sp. TaxID=153152 RepID=UPI002664F358|nr:hypothetical protein [uncultured Lactobacillus sp.]
MNPTKEELLYWYKSSLSWLKKTVSELPEPEERLVTLKELSHVAWIALGVNAHLEDIEKFEQKQKEEQESKKEGSSHE